MRWLLGKDTHCLIKNPLERKLMPHRRIHSNDPATIRAEVKGDRAHHGQQKGVAGEMAKRYREASKKKIGTADRGVPGADRLHPPSCCVAAALLGYHCLGPARR